MKNFLTLILAVSISVAASAQADLLTNMKPGECVAQCIVPATFRTETVRVLVSPEYKVLSVVPATYKTVTEEVLVKEATKRYVYHPAEYKTETVTFVGRAEEPTLSVVNATFNNSSETFEVYPKVTKIEFTSLADCISDNPEDCRVQCVKEYPSSSETVATKVLASNATTTSGSVAKVMDSYTKQVIVKAAYTEEIIIPAEYTTITKHVIDQPAKVVEEVVPAVYDNVEKTILVTPETMKIEAIDCKLLTPNILPIFWDLNSARLNAKARSVVDEHLLSLLQESPNISVELSSHTDSRGSDEYNRALSQRRADAIKNYLVSRGIKASRLVSKGYGETRLKNNCGNGVDCSESRHQENRRTEYRVLSGR